eukprot:1157163-Pelagomonas_calceolata.AAC.3
MQGGRFLHGKCIEIAASLGCKQGGHIFVAARAKVGPLKCMQDGHVLVIMKCIAQIHIVKHMQCGMCRREKVQGNKPEDNSCVHPLVLCTRDVAKASRKECRICSAAKVNIAGTLVVCKSWEQRLCSLDGSPVSVLSALDCQVAQLSLMTTGCMQDALDVRDGQQGGKARFMDEQGGIQVSATDSCLLQELLTGAHKVPWVSVHPRLPNCHVLPYNTAGDVACGSTVH